MNQQSFFIDKIGNPTLTESNWNIISNTIAQSMNMNNSIKVQYHLEGETKKVIGKVYDVNNMDKKLTVKHDEGFSMVNFGQLTFATVIAS